MFLGVHGAFGRAWKPASREIFKVEIRKEGRFGERK
jgi:hypothetical protein